MENNYTFKRIICRVLIFSLAISIFLVPLLVCAEDISFPLAAYSKEELVKVREWEKNMAGKKISTENVDQVKEFLSEVVHKAMKEPQTFGAGSLWFEVVPYRPYEFSKGMIEATKKYAPNSKLDDKEVLVNFGEVAGIPFPQPKTGAEMAWNFDSNTRGDTHYVLTDGEVVDCKTRLERHAGMLRWDTYWMSRTDVPPVPKIPDDKNSRGIFRSFFQRHIAPVDFVDTTMLEIRYKDLTQTKKRICGVLYRHVPENQALRNEPENRYHRRD